MADPLVHSAGPVTPLGGFPGRSPQPPHGEPPRGQLAPQPNGDQVRVQGAALSLRRLLRERVLARTRQLFALDDVAHVPEFAEALEAESVAELLGRLLSAQNQLAALVRPPLGAQRLRDLQAEALTSGAAETLELLGDEVPGEAAALVAALLAEFARRVRSHAGDAIG